MEINIPFGRELTAEETELRNSVLQFNQRKQSPRSPFVNDNHVDISKINIGDVVVLTAEATKPVTSFQVTGLVVRNNVQHSFIYSNNRKIEAKHVLRVIKAKRFGMAA